MKSKIYLALTGAVIITAISLLIVRAQQQQPSEPHNMSHDEMNKRGDMVMGFDHTKTTHHFLLTADGGSIEAVANTADDTNSRDQIRGHFGHIAKMFAEGNFKAPILIHDQDPPGVPVMQKLKDEIKYEFEKTDRGGRVKISTTNPEALRAIHEFLRFQIKEHKTGDPLEVNGAPASLPASG
jgi:hypothetical protein